VELDVEMGFLTVLHGRLGAKTGDLRAKDSHSFRNKQRPDRARQKCTDWRLVYLVTGLDMT